MKENFTLEKLERANKLKSEIDVIKKDLELLKRAQVAEGFFVPTVPRLSLSLTNENHTVDVSNVVDIKKILEHAIVLREGELEEKTKEFEQV